MRHGMRLSYRTAGTSAFLFLCLPPSLYAFAFPQCQKANQVKAWNIAMFKNVHDGTPETADTM